MKKVLYPLAAMLTLLLAFNLCVAAQQEQPKAQTWTGWISDSACAAKGTSAEHKACATKCVKEKGAKWVVVNSADKAVLNIHNQDAVNAEKDLGQEVKVTGHLNPDGSVHVESITPAK